jgi:hypothetical protein
MHKILTVAALGAGVALAAPGVASAQDPTPTATADKILSEFLIGGVFVRALGLDTNTLKFEPCNLHVPLNGDTYPLSKGTKSTTWLGPGLPQTPYNFNANNKKVSLFSDDEGPKWNPVLVILDRGKALGHAVQFFEVDANTNVSNFNDDDWAGATTSGPTRKCWSRTSPADILACNVDELTDLIERMKRSYFGSATLDRGIDRYNEVRLFNYDPSAIVGLIIEDRQCQRTNELSCKLDDAQLQRLQTLVNAFWHGPKQGTENPCPAPQVKPGGYGLSKPLDGYAAKYNTIAGNGQSELPVFRLGYSGAKEIAGKQKPTQMELHYVTSIAPGTAAAAIDLAGLDKDKDL